MEKPGENRGGSVSSISKVPFPAEKLAHSRNPVFRSGLRTYLLDRGK
ncbi:hypothetical protein LEP1GSC061_2354 [Leptospira wolffii serovar Khorat str. Khorat-H2]|nr:hypothetical protein LEP1GSC061_2354 [Leptospira wolffii serovar Khorat str. Khorat-H2]